MLKLLLRSLGAEENTKVLADGSTCALCPQLAGVSGEMCNQHNLPIVQVTFKFVNKALLVDKRWLRVAPDSPKE